MANENKRIEEIYHLALEKKNKKERSAYLDSACGDDSKLRASVEGLLQAHDKAGDFLEVPPFDPDVTLDSSPLTEGPGTTIGNYKLLEQIGEGGMAVVYMAEQEKPLRRRVALKIIKLGMDTKSVIARFEVERQALAVMDHPNIAKVLDAGTTETGRPYFVMELVRGVSISKYCDKNKLDTKERLDLFVQVCNAVQHAHQKGIIHRDIKPSNVMVTLRDGKSVPKVIDFGIAKATSQRLTEKTLFTQYAQMIGTPAYMSPEQAEYSELDIDTRTDIYSLGVLLYELLTGATPFSEEQLREAGYLEMQRIIREEEPTKPSTKLSTLGEVLTDVAEHRKTDPGLLTKLVRGDLDWIVMKSLEKDRSRRYATATGLAADVERHFNSEPVLAAAPSVSYRLRKFVRRNRALVTGVTAVLVVLVGGILVSTFFAMGQARARDEAEERARILRAMNPFFEWDLAVLDYPWAYSVRELPFSSLLEHASQQIQQDLAVPPLFEASFYGSLGMMYQSIGEYDAAEPHLERALEFRREQLGEDDPSVLVSTNNLAMLYVNQGRYDEAEPLLVRTLKLSRRALGDKHIVTLDSIHNCLGKFVKGFSLVGTEQYIRGTYEEALATLTRVDKLRLLLSLESRPSDLALLAMALYHLGRHEDTKAALERLHLLFEDGRHAHDLEWLCKAELLCAGENSKVCSAWGCIKAGNLKEASQVLEELQSLPRRENTDIAACLKRIVKTLARAYHNRGRNAKHSNGGYGETIADYESAVQVDPSFALAFNDLAWLRAACPATEYRDTAKAIQHATKACELTNWKDHSYVGTLAAVYARVDDFGSAVKWQKKAVDLLPREERSKWQTNYGTRLKLYESGRTYDKGNMRSFSTGNMVAWWKFDRKEGLNVIDSSGNGLNGKLVGGARIVGDAERGNVLRLNGVGGHVDCGNHPLFDIVDEITIAARIKASRFDTEYPAIVCKGNYSWRLLLYDRESNAEFCCTGTDVEGFVWGNIVGSANVSDGKWHHISGVYNGRELCLYVDGMLDNSVNASGLINTNVFSVMIGKNEERPGREWNGLIDDVRIYNYALSKAEVKAISDDCGQIQTGVR